MKQNTHLFLHCRGVQARVSARRRPSPASRALMMRTVVSSPSARRISRSSLLRFCSAW